MPSFCCFSRTLPSSWVSNISRFLVCRIAARAWTFESARKRKNDVVPYPYLNGFLITCFLMPILAQSCAQAAHQGKRLLRCCAAGSPPSTLAFFASDVVRCGAASAW